MTQPMTDEHLVARVLEHIDRGTTDMGDEVWREPVANYRSPQRFERELAVLRKSTSAFCPSASLPAAGSYLARTAAGTPVVAVRGADRRVRAFVNVCRHRGNQVASGTGSAKVLVCGYHGWAYGLDGRLSHVPDEHGFPDLDKACHGLVPLAASECHGIVFVNQDRNAKGADPGDVPALLAPDQKLLSTSERDTEANWKIVLEGFIEGYHIKATHPESFLPYGFDNLNVVELFGRHSRVTYPFKRIEKLRKTPPAERRAVGYVTYVYQLFPNVLFTVLSSHSLLIVLEPLDIGRTRVVTYMLTNGGGESERAVAEAKRDAGFVGSTGAAEDRAVVTAIQRGIASGANDHFTFGRFEPAIVHFHRELDSALAELG